MKYEGHVSTGMYSYIGFTDAETPEEAAQAYREIEDAFKPKPANGLPDKEWRTLLDQTLKGPIVGDPGILDELNPLQRFCVNEIKKAKKRA